MSNYTKKPFDLEYMKAHPETKLVTRDGREVTDWHYFKSITGDYPTIAVIGGCGIVYTNKGFYEVRNNHNPLDLLMLVPCEEKVGYFNVYNDATIKASWATFEEAKDSVSQSFNPTHIVKVTITEGQDPTFEIVHTY